MNAEVSMVVDAILACDERPPQQDVVGLIGAPITNLSTDPQTLSHQEPTSQLTSLLLL